MQAKILNIPTLSISHGNISGYFLNGHKKVDKYCVFGKNDKEEMIRYGCLENKIVITGNPYLDKIPKKKNNIDPSIINTLNINNRFNNYCLIAFSGVGPILNENDHKININIVEQLIIKFPEILFIIKLHRKDNYVFYKKIASRSFSNLYIARSIESNLHPNIFTWLNGCNLVITVSSSVAVEAMYYKIPVINIDHKNNFQDITFIKNKSTITVRSSSELIKKVKLLFSKSKDSNNAFNDDYIKTDGKSTLRCASEIIRLSN